MARLSKLIVYSLFLLPIISCNEKKEACTAKPNILFLFADDQRADALGCAGNPYIKTPNIDKLAESGVRFSNNYIMGGHHGAICAPSRAMLMSGQSLFHLYSGFDMKKWVDDKVLNDEITMPAYFTGHGYETFGTGKWHNGAQSFETSFQHGDNVFIGGMCDHFKVPCRTLENGKLSKPVTKGYSTDLFADAAKQFLDGYAKGSREKPFFCYVAFTAPHDPRSPREGYIGMYPDEAVPVPANFKKAHPFEFDNMQIRDETLAPWPRTPEIIQASIADYYGLISHIDDRVGDIISTLKENGLYENTIIVYAADNGLAIGSHGLLGKQNLYEHSMKVPLIMAGPGIPKGGTSPAFTYMYDMFPTLCQLSGLPLPEGVEGKDLSPVIKGEKQGVRKSIFTVYRNTVRAVRQGQWKLIRYPERGYTQLFNLGNDPYEINNLAADQQYNAKIDSLLGLLKQCQHEAGDTVALTANKTLPLGYDYKKLKQTQDQFQPEYVLKKYFEEIE